MGGTGKGMTIDASWMLSFGVDGFGRRRNDECCLPSTRAVVETLVATATAVLSIVLAGRLRWRYPLDLADGKEDEEGWSIALAGCG